MTALAPAQRACAHTSPPRLTTSQAAVAMKTVQGIFAGVTTRQLDQLAAETCECHAGHGARGPARSCAVCGRQAKRARGASAVCAPRTAPRAAPHTSPTHPVLRAGAYSSTYHPDWSILAARIVVSDLHKQTESSFSKLAASLHGYKHPVTGTNAALIADDVAEIIAKNADRLDNAIKYERDFE